MSSPSVPAGKRNISDDITIDLLKRLLGGDFAPGDRLPPERELASRFKTNRNTLREAIRNLQTMNVVDARQGDGLRVLDFRTDGEINLLPHFLRYSGDGTARISVVADMLQLRRMLLAEVCVIVARRSAEVDIDKIDSLLAELNRNMDDAESRILIDLEIAMTLVEASGSLAFRWIFNTMGKLFAEVALQWPTLWVFPDSYLSTLNAVVDSIRSGDESGARESMEHHLERSDDVIMATLRSLDLDTPR
jgi:GntR family transcriptional regulator, transcriptional repressor for pyruvate dehydrogenase complex